MHFVRRFSNGGAPPLPRLVTPYRSIAMDDRIAVVRPWHLPLPLDSGRPADAEFVVLVFLLWLLGSALAMLSLVAHQLFPGLVTAGARARTRQLLAWRYLIRHMGMAIRCPSQSTASFRGVLQLHTMYPPFNFFFLEQ
jgi:hypothetical protein